MTAVTAPGLYPNLSETYHSMRHTPTKALSASGIKVLINETPLDYITPKDKATAAMNFGTIVHSLTLAKHQKFSVSPFDDYRTKDARQWRDDTVAEGLIPIKEADFAEANAMAEILKKKIAHILGGAPYETEVPFYWQEGDTWCQGMLDVWCEDLLVGLDPKITPYVHKRAAAHMVNMGHDIQAAWYRRGLEKIFPEHAGRIRFANLLIKPDAPYTSRVIMMNEAWRASAEAECMRGLRIFDRCMAANEWPGYSDDIEMLDIPSWTLKERMEMEMMEDEQAV